MYQAGDKVKVCENLYCCERWRKSGVNVTSEMEDFKGKIVTIRNRIATGEDNQPTNYFIVEDDGDYIWHESMFEKLEEAVSHPSHYNVGKIEVIDFIEDKKLNFNLGNAVKYIARCQYKVGGAKRIEDLEKAAWYINHQIGVWKKEEVTA